MNMEDKQPLEYWLKEARATIQEIYDRQYYVELWEKVKHEQPLDQLSKTKLLEPFQLFWESLPDKPDIRIPPFFRICDLAGEYCFGESS